MRAFSINTATKEAAYKAAGFSQIKEVFDEKGDVILSTTDIRTICKDKYGFTEGQVSGAIRRACEKQLLFPLGNATYIYNIDFPFGVAPYISNGTIIAAQNGQENLEPIDDAPTYAFKEEPADKLKCASQYLLLHYQCGIRNIYSELSTCINIMCHDFQSIVSYKKFLFFFYTYIDILSNTQNKINENLTKLRDAYNDINDDFIEQTVDDIVKKGLTSIVTNIELIKVCDPDVKWCRDNVAAFSEIFGIDW
ncbi:hypothetical protein J6A31_04865 [bacterium]|nr:hypothetical protein [bacterium]